MSIKESITIQDVCDLLNEMLKLDPKATKCLAQNKVSCNRSIAEHPSIQVSETDQGYYVGMVGILNGLFGTGTDNMGAICYKLDDGGNIEGFMPTPMPTP